MISKSLKPTYISFIGILVIIFPFLFLDKGYFVVLFDTHRNPFLDNLFLKLSGLGDTITVLIFSLVIILSSKLKWFYSFFLAFCIQLVIVLLMKHLIFDHTYRPKAYFDTLGYVLHPVDGVKLYSFDSFPSGHTTTIFFLSTFFSLKFKNLFISIALFILALFVGVSRIYLAQHFFADVFCGMLIGFLAANLGNYFMLKKVRLWYVFTLLQWIRFKKAKSKAVQRV